MKKINLLFLLFTISIYCQSPKGEYLIRPESYILDGYYWTRDGTNSRKIIPVVIPKNTAKWIYSVCVTKNVKDNSFLSSIVKILAPISLSFDQSGTTAFLIESSQSILDYITQSGKYDDCDVYLIKDKAEADKFKNRYKKGTYEDEIFDFVDIYSRTKFNSGIIQVKKKYKSDAIRYIGIKNNNLSEEIKVVVYAIAYKR